MSLKCGIVGLPNVGKSTLFNALTQTQAAEAANYPFCTIDPNVGSVGVPDKRLPILSSIAKSKKTIAARVDFVDIAGLVKGANKGEGLGNQFLGHIKSTDALVHVLRCFENDDITHVEGKIDPLRDLEIVETELMLADLASAEERLTRLSKKSQNTKENEEKKALFHKAVESLSQGLSLRPTRGERSIFHDLELLSDKPTLLVCNVAENEATTGNEYTEKVQQYAKDKGLKVLLVSASIEAEVASFSEEEQNAFLQPLGLHETGLARVIRESFDLLNLSTFFTAGPEETHAWTIERHTLAPDAAAEIHTDFKKGFICAETISYADFIAYNGELGAKQAGKMRLEGKEYRVQDGDIMHFRFNV
jgi:GTP-binding protein YchF